MKLSVLMPVYNTEESFLREAIESILSQTFSDFEFLIINDGSKNNAKEVILSYDDSRIKYIENEQNLGLIKTLNKGFSLAQGEYIARMDADDISLPTRFEKQVNFLNENPQVGVLGTWFKWFPKERLMDSASDSKKIKETLLLMHNEIGHPTVMLRASVLNEHNSQYDEKALYVEDYALWLSLVDKTEFANIPEVLLNYRIHGGSICKNNKIRQNINCQEIMFKAQGKFFGVDNSKVLQIIEMLNTNEKINAADIKEIIEFSHKIKQKTPEYGFNEEYKVNRVFFRYALKNCKKDFAFLQLILSGALKKISKD